MKIVTSLVAFLTWTSVAVSQPLVCTDAKSNIKLAIADPIGSETSSERSAELIDLRNWEKPLSFFMKGWGLEGWQFSSVYKTSDGMISLEVDHSFAVDYASVTTTKVDCREVQVGESCKLVVERVQAACSE